MLNRKVILGILLTFSFTAYSLYFTSSKKKTSNRALVQTKQNQENLRLNRAPAKNDKVSEVENSDQSKFVFSRSRELLVKDLAHIKASFLEERSHHLEAVMGLEHDQVLNFRSLEVDFLEGLLEKGLDVEGFPVCFLEGLNVEIEILESEAGKKLFLSAKKRLRQKQARIFGDTKLKEYLKFCYEFTDRLKEDYAM